MGEMGMTGKQKGHSSKSQQKDSQEKNPQQQKKKNAPHSSGNQKKSKFFKFSRKRGGKARPLFTSAAEEEVRKEGAVKAILLGRDKKGFEIWRRAGCFEGCLKRAEPGVGKVSKGSKAEARLKDLQMLWLPAGETQLEELLNTGRFFAVDTEGSNGPGGEFLVEVGAVYFENFVPKTSYTSIINNNRPIFWATTKVHGISTEMAKKRGKPEAHVMRELAEFLGEGLSGQNLVVFHGGENDIPDLTKAFLKVGIEGQAFVVDTQEMVRQWETEFKFTALSRLCEVLQLENPRPHEAVSDALATGLLFVELLHRRFPERVASVRRDLKLPDHFFGRYPERHKKGRASKKRMADVAE